MADIQEGEAESSKGKNLWDPSLNAPTFLEKALLPAEEREMLMAHDENHFVREAIRQFSQALPTSCLAATKMKERKVAEDLKAQESPSSAERWNTCKVSSSIPKTYNKKLSNTWSRKPRRQQVKPKRLLKKRAGSIEQA